MQARHEQQVSEEQKKQDSMLNATIASTTIATVESADIGMIFMLSGSESLKLLFENTLRYFMLPIAAGSTIALAGLDWYQVWLARNEAYTQNKGYRIAKAIAATLVAAAITTAVVGALAFSYVVAGAYIFATTFAANSLFKAGSAAYFGWKAYHETNANKKAELWTRTGEATIGAVAGIIGTSAIIAVMIFSMPALAVLGVIAGTIGAVAGTIGFIRLLTQPKIPAQVLLDLESNEEPRLQQYTTAKLGAHFQINKNDYSALVSRECSSTITANTISQTLEVKDERSSAIPNLTLGLRPSNC